MTNVENRRGNTNAAGKKGEYPDGTMTYQALVRLSDRHYALALYAGGGNLSRGIRRLIEDSAQSVDVEGKPLTRFEATGLCYAQKAADEAKSRKAGRAAKIRIKNEADRKYFHETDEEEAARDSKLWDDLKPGDDNDD